MYALVKDYDPELEEDEAEELAAQGDFSHDSGADKPTPSEESESIEKQNKRIAEHRKRRDRKRNIADGIITLDRTASTGIKVQLFSLKKLKDKTIDPDLVSIPADSESIILNIDYAFGEQAGEIMRNLLLLFGNNIGSINILGKTGSLVGQRGDILLPTAFVEQSDDLFLPVENRALERINRLQKRLPGRNIYKGPMLTVAGTLFQNRMMLSFYRHMWDSIGLEMEGVYYLRQIVEARQHALIPDKIPMNFYYYVSDLPAAEGNQLSMKMALSEGIPPLYAVTREVLSDIFTIEAEERS